MDPPIPSIPDKKELMSPSEKTVNKKGSVTTSLLSMIELDELCKLIMWIMNTCLPLYHTLSHSRLKPSLHTFYKRNIPPQHPKKMNGWKRDVLYFYFAFRQLNTAWRTCCWMNWRQRVAIHSFS